MDEAISPFGDDEAALDLPRALGMKEARVLPLPVLRHRVAEVVELARNLAQWVAVPADFPSDVGAYTRDELLATVEKYAYWLAPASEYDEMRRALN
jgi:hypothetical protein